MHHSTLAAMATSSGGVCEDAVVSELTGVCVCGCLLPLPPLCYKLVFHVRLAPIGMHACVGMCDCVWLMLRCTCGLAR